MWSFSFKKFYRKMTRREPIVVISGLPRSGTSMAMKMLEAGGMALFTDQVRRADEDNPKGYFEYERVKQLKNEQDKSWLAGARGKAVKIISELLKELPDDLDYRVIFMNRSLEEVIASQNKMLIRRGEPTNTDEDEQMEELFQTHLRAVKSWIDRRPNFDVLQVDYKNILENPYGQAEQIQQFLGRQLDVEKMVKVVDRTLYRNRASSQLTSSQ